MRANVDYGPAVLPVGSVLEQKSLSLPDSNTEKSAALLATMLTGTMYDHQSNDMSGYQVKDASVFVAPDEFLFDEAGLLAKLEKSCCNMRQGKFSEIRVKVAPEIIPETFIQIRKTTDGVHIAIESTSAETRHWLQSVRTRLSSHLHQKLQCLVEVDIIDGNSLLHKADQENLAKHARYL